MDYTCRTRKRSVVIAVCQVLFLNIILYIFLNLDFNTVLLRSIIWGFIYGNFYFGVYNELKRESTKTSNIQNISHSTTE